MTQDTFNKIDSVYKQLEASKGKISYAILSKEAQTSKRNISEYFKIREGRGTGTTGAGTGTTGTAGTTGAGTGTTGTAGTTPLKKMLAETKLTPSTSFRTPEEVNQLANYLLNEKKEVTEEEIFTRYAEQGELDAFIQEMNFIRRNIGSLFLRCKPLLIQLIEPFPDEYKERALKELNIPVRN